MSPRHFVLFGLVCAALLAPLWPLLELAERDALLLAVTIVVAIVVLPGRVSRQGLSRP